MRAPSVGGTVAGRHIMLVEMRACIVSGMGGCKPGAGRVGSAPLTSVNGLFRVRLYLVTVAVTIYN